MVSSISYKLGQNRLVTGFGAHHRAHHSTYRNRPTYGHGIVRTVRRTFGALSRPVLVYGANKLSDLISGDGYHHRVHTVRRRRTVHSAGSFRPSGYGIRRHRITLNRRRTTTVGGYRPRKTVRRAPRRTLGCGTRHRRVYTGTRVNHRRHILLI